jgi:hypothetical protein
MRTKSAGGRQSGRSLWHRPRRELVQMAARHGRRGTRPSPQIPLRCIVRHRVQLFCRVLRGKLTAVYREFRAKLRIDIVAGQRPMLANRRTLTVVNGRLDCSCVQPWASRKGLPGQRVMAQNRAIDGIGRHRNSLLRVRRNGRRCDGSPVNR